MATWTSQEGHAPPRCYFSAAAWAQQLVLERGLPNERVPWIFRGRTMAEHHARFPDGVAAPDPGATYCEDCGLLVVAKSRHEASVRHLAATQASRPASSRSRAAVGSVDLAAIQAQMRADPAFAAAILASAAAATSRPANIAAAAPPIELLGPGVSGVSEGSALRAEAPPESSSPALATPAAEAAVFLAPTGGGLAPVLEPRPADPAATTPMEQSLEDQGPTRDLLKLLDEFSRR